MSVFLPKADLELGDPARQVIAWTVTDAAKRLNKTIPTWVNIANAVNGIVPYDDIKGASTLTVTMTDPEWDLLTSGIFSPTNRQGRLDPMAMEYPVGSGYWWRLNQVSPKGSTRQIQLTFFDRIVSIAQETYRHLKANRATTTRAEFLWWVFKNVPHAYFFSERLHQRQVVDPGDATPVSSTQSTSSNKTVGLGANYSGCTVTGRPMTKAQAAVANKLLMVAHNAHANEAATAALIFAGIWESRLNEQADNGRYWGVLQASHGNFSKTDTIGMATSFLHGGRGFQGGGAIALSRHTSNPVEIAVRVEVPSIWPDNAYAREGGYLGNSRAVAEAQKIVREGGGAAGGTVTTTDSGPGTTVAPTEPFTFEWGPADNPNETAWDCAQRLAQEVNWELFTNGDTVYFDADTTLIKQKPSAVIGRGDASVVDWYYDWESRQIATQMTLLLIMEDFGFRAGEVIKLDDFGPASDSSTAGLPGRWLIANITRNPGDYYSTLTLAQPTPPKIEPAASASGAGGGSSISINAAPGSSFSGGAVSFTNLGAASTHVPGHPELKPRVSQIVNVIRQAFPDLIITSTLRPGGTSYHATGQACDLALSMTGSGIAGMNAAAAWVDKNLAPYLLEGIHNPNLSVKNGRRVAASFWGSATWAQHLNHIHVAA